MKHYIVGPNNRCLCGDYYGSVTCQDVRNVLDHIEFIAQCEDNPSMHVRKGQPLPKLDYKSVRMLLRIMKTLELETE